MCHCINCHPEDLEHCAHCPKAHPPITTDEEHVEWSTADHQDHWLLQNVGQA